MKECKPYSEFLDYLKDYANCLLPPATPGCFGFSLVQPVTYDTVRNAVSLHLAFGLLLGVMMELGCRTLATYGFAVWLVMLLYILVSPLMARGYITASGMRPLNPTDPSEKKLLDMAGGICPGAIVYVRDIREPVLLNAQRKLLAIDLKERSQDDGSL